jgi:dTMP kinase
MAQRRGLLIALEGGDRSGKTTQFLRLQHADSPRLKGAHYLRFPERQLSSTGALITNVLDPDNLHNTMNARATHLLFTANRWEFAPAIIEWLSKGHDVITDRYSHSGVAYSAAQGVDVDWALRTEHGLPKPDLILYMQLNPRVAANRAEFGREALETEEIQHGVVSQFDRWAAEDPGTWSVVDASRTEDDVNAEINRLIESADHKRGTPLRLFE